MKYVSLLCVICLLWSCENHNDYEVVTVAEPIVMSKADFRASVEVLPVKNIEEAGKIYVYGDYLFVNDTNKGVHVIDNSNPSAPVFKCFINIPGNVDVSVKNNYLYADSAVDLLVFDISNPAQITLVKRLEEVFDYYDYRMPFVADYVNFESYHYENQIIVGWELKQERREKVESEMVFFDTAETAAFNQVKSDNQVGTGGSLARFQIVEQYLYTVGISTMTIFDIENLAQPNKVNALYSGWNIETMFYAEGFLYLGGSNGMYIYTLENPKAPVYVSEFTHWEGCDPVVVQGNYAYLTLRGGNSCGQDESVLEVIDISDKTQPTLGARYMLKNPYGLGVLKDQLYVCDGTAGLKLFNVENPLQIEVLKTYSNIQAKDVIPLNDKLIVVGDKVVKQYHYTNNDLIPLSTLKLN